MHAELNINFAKYQTQDSKEYLKNVTHIGYGNGFKVCEVDNELMNKLTIPPTSKM